MPPSEVVGTELLHEQHLINLKQIYKCISVHNGFSKRGLLPAMIYISNHLVPTIKDLYEMCSLQVLTRIKHMQKYFSFLFYVVCKCCDDFQKVNAHEQHKCIKLIECTAQLLE